MGRFDPSHDVSHIQRVCELAEVIESRERSSNPTICYFSDVIALASLLHDVGEKEYLLEGEDGENMVEHLLLSLSGEVALESEVQAIVNHVSYSSEVKDTDKVQDFLSQHPELAVVQDADCLDALGSFGIARCFAYNAVKKYNLGTAVAYFVEKLENLEGVMKTQAGKQIAATRTQRLKV